MLNALSSLTDLTLISGGAALILFGLFMALFARGDIGRLTAGIFRLGATIFTAPIHYLEAAVRRIVEHCHEAREDHFSDRQYLLQRLLLVSNALIFIVAAGILALGVLGAWRTVYSPQLAAFRQQLSENVGESNRQIDDTQKQLTEISTKLGTETEADRHIKQLTDRSLQLENQMKTSREGLDKLDSTAAGQWKEVSNYLQSQESPYANDSQLRNSAEVVTAYLLRASTPEPARQSITAYVNTWVDYRLVQRQLREEQSSNPHERLIQQKAALEVRIAGEKSNVAQMQEQLGLGRLLKELQFRSGLWALIMTYLSFTFFVWMAGLMIELAGLMVDIAGNVRLARASLQHGVGAPVEPEPVAAMSR